MTKVMIVDDAAFMRLTVRTMLEKHGYQVVGEAENGSAALRKYIECKPDLVTKDITMPEMNGIEALAALKKLDPKATVVMITAMGQADMVKEAVLKGAATFIVKPFQEEHLIQTLQKITGN